MGERTHLELSQKISFVTNSSRFAFFVAAAGFIQVCSMISKQMLNEILCAFQPRHKGSINLGVLLVCLQYCISAGFTPSNYTKKHFRAKMFNLH